MSFDLLAAHYRWMEFLSAGPLLQRCRLAHLADIGAPRHALILGEGNGRFLAEFLVRCPSAQVTCVDSSARMLTAARERARRRGLTLGRVRFCQSDVLTWSPPPGEYDLVVTHYFLDCFRPEQLGEIIPRIAAALTSEGCWLVADFCEPTAGFRRWRARLILAVMYAFFRRVTALPADRLTPPDPFLQRAGLELRSRRQFDWQLLHADLWQKVNGPGRVQEFPAPGGTKSVAE